MGTKRDHNLGLLQYGYHTGYHDTVCSINPCEWQDGLSNCYFSKARISSMETLTHGWNWNTCSLRNSFLFSQLCEYGLKTRAAPTHGLRRLMMTLLRLSSAVRQKKAYCLPWGRKPGQAKWGHAGECPQPAVSGLVMLPLSCSFLFCTFPALLVSAPLLISCHCILPNCWVPPCYKQICFFWWGGWRTPRRCGCLHSSSNCFLHKPFVTRN